MTSRTSVRPHYDAVVGLLPRGTIPSLAYAIVKVTLDTSTGRATHAEPLVQDVWDPATPARLAPGSDYWLDKVATDVVVTGDVVLERAAPETEVGIRVGSVAQRIAVRGRRMLRWQGGRPHIDAPHPFERIAMSWANAYGGVDRRVPVPSDAARDLELVLEGDHPGLYPRNPMGKGYVVVDAPADGIELPHLEDPTDSLTPARIVVGRPERWFLQPRPVCFAGRSPVQFPRLAHFGLDAWFPAPDDERLPEVRSGELPRNWRGSTQHFALARQEASPGLAFAELPPGTPIAVSGMAAGGRTISVAVPPAPRIAIGLEGRFEALPARLTLVVVRPNDARVTCTFAATTTRMHRVFVPGVHAEIPLAVRIDDDDAIPYEAPPTPGTRP